MPQQPAVNDDPIPETAPPAGITYKPVTSRMVEDLGKRVVGGQPLKPEDLTGWGPQATRALSRWLGMEVGSDVTNAGNLLNRALSANMPPEKFAEELDKQVRNTKMRHDLVAGYHQGMSPQERANLFRTMTADQQAFDQSYIKVIGDRMGAVNSPPVLRNVSASAFKPAEGPTTDKSEGNYQYAVVTPQQAANAANDLLMGKRGEVKSEISTWGAKGLYQLLTEYRDHRWPDDLRQAGAAVTAIGTPEYADQLKKIQSPELKALVEKESAAFANGKSRNEIQSEFNVGQKQIYGAAIGVYNEAIQAVHAREAQFLAQKQAGAAASSNAGVSAPPGSDIAKTAQIFAHEPYSNWPTLNGWTAENIAKLQIATNDQIRNDRDTALGIAMDAVNDRKRIDEVQNPVMKRIIERDINVGEPYEVISRHIQEAAQSQISAVNVRIQNTTSAISPPPQKQAAPGGPGGA